MGAIRILHVVDGLDRGGITGWLMGVLRHLSGDEFRMDFLVHTDKTCAYDAEASALGARIIHCPEHRRPLRYSRRFLRILQQYGPYDVVHSHCHRFSGLLLFLAYRASVPVRIAHSHADSSQCLLQEGVARKAYNILMNYWVERYSTTGLAVGPATARDLFGPAWESNSKHRILYTGIDTESFHQSYDRAAVRSGLNLPADALVVGHVGRFTRPKNHLFILEVFAHALRLEPRVRLVLIGDGDEEQRIRSKTAEMGLENSVIFLGSRPDIPRLLLGALDIFLFPSTSEGLGLALVEAQAAGLPCIVSANVPEEVAVVKPLVTRLPLDLPAQHWGKELIRIAARPPAVARSEALQRIEKSPFTIRSSMRCLEKVYTTARSL